MTMAEKLYTLQEAGAEIQRHEREVRRLIKQGVLRAKTHPRTRGDASKPGRPRLFIPQSEIDRYIAETMPWTGDSAPTEVSKRRRRERRGLVNGVEQFV